MTYQLIEAQFQSSATTSNTVEGRADLNTTNVSARYCYKCTKYNDRIIKKLPYYHTDPEHEQKSSWKVDKSEK
jgi:hypothetical protein